MGLAEPMELPVLGQEGQPVRNDHAGPQMVQQVLGREGALFAVALQQLIGQKRGKVGVLELRIFVFKRNTD